MEFRTTFDIPAEKGLVNYTNGPVILLGSCFADGVGQRLMERMFPVTVNPFGPLYNPASIAMIIETALSGKTITEDDLFHHEGLYRSFLCHTLLCSTSADETCRRLNAALLRLRNDLAKARLLIITLGTSKIYRRKNDGMVVANCHKLPASQFTSSMLSEAEITDCLENIIDMVSGFNPGIRIMFTVSPVRHKADGIHANNLSKARLLLAVDRVIELHGNRALYFPAYELVMDDLRDYRFYAADMCHPSETAVDYVFSRFAQAYITDAAMATAAKCLKISRRLSHRQMTADEEAFARFREATVRELTSLQKEHPELTETIQTIITNMH